MEQIIRFGLVGVRGIAKSHLTGISQNVGTEAVAVCDIHEDIAKRIAETYHVPSYYTDYDEMLKREDIDVIKIRFESKLEEMQLLQIVVSLLKWEINLVLLK